MTAELTLRPATMAAGGSALARDGAGRVVFVEGALPGELVVARVTDERSGFARAVAVEVLEASADRVAPPCPWLASGCGGCTWQHVATGAQPRLKAATVLDALRRIGRLADPPAPSFTALAGPPLRTTVRLAVSAGGRAGYRRRGDNGPVVAPSGCLVCHPRVEEMIVDGRFPGADEVLLRAGVASGERLARLDRRGVPSAASVPAGVKVVADGDGREASVHESVAGRRLRVSAGSFFQPGPVAAAGLVEAVRAAVGDRLAGVAHLLDAYGGVGLFASVLGASTGAQVTLVDNNPPALADARVNLADLDARVVASEVGRWRLPRAGRAVDVVVADPPRSGLARPGASAVVATGAARVVLVSCDPASLGRDARLLGEAGYRLATVALVDAFPHTFHTETVSRFDR